MNMKDHNDVIKEYELMKYKYSIYAPEHEWLQCFGIGHCGPANCLALVAIIIIIIFIIIMIINIKYDKRE